MELKIKRLMTGLAGFAAALFLVGRLGDLLLLFTFDEENESQGNHPEGGAREIERGAHAEKFSENTADHRAENTARGGAPLHETQTPPHFFARGGGGHDG